MVAKLNLTIDERASRIREQNRLRASAYYAKKKGDAEFQEKRRDYKQGDKDALKAVPPAKKQSSPKPTQPAPASATTPVQKQPAQSAFLSNKGKFIVKTINKIKYTIPKLTIDEIKQFMINNPHQVLDRAKQTPLPEKTLKDYVSRLSTLAKQINGTDDFITAFMDADKTVNIIKNLTKQNGDPLGYNSISKKLTVLFSAVRALNRAGLLKPLDDEKLNPIFDKYDNLFQQKNAERIIQENENKNNPNFAVPEWADFEDKIVKEYGENSTEHLITVLYRFNTVRNDYVGLKIIKNKFTEGGADGFYMPSSTAGVRIVSNRKKTGDGYGKIDYTFDKRVSAVIRKYIRIKKIKEGDSLLPNSIHNIVKEMLNKVGIKMPPNAKPVSVFRNIDSGIDENMNPEALVEKAKRSGHSVGTKLNTYGRKKKETPVVLENTVVHNTRRSKK